MKQHFHFQSIQMESRGGRVAMFMEGKMIEYGTHDSLMAQGGEYAKMFKIQSQYYIDEIEKLAKSEGLL